jgi:hypothetical protein
MATRLARHHAQNGRVGKPQRGLNRCARCGDSVPHDSDHLRAQLQGSTVVLHWRCFLALMRGSGDASPIQRRRLKGRDLCVMRKPRPANARRVGC